ncbi:MAG: hypothetical protein J6W38_09435 [Prevotella sp.]|nr:hypothetical protein [Prevotella sp.]
MMTKDLEEEKSLRELLLALNEGLTVYRSLNKNYVPIKVSFSQCAYMTATTAIEELSAYIANLDRDICQEPLCLDLDEMGSEDYWMEKLSKLRSDMTELEEVPLLQRKLIWGYLGFYPWTTTEFYMGVEEKVMEVARLLRQVQQKMAEKPLSFYGKFYHDQRAQYCEEQAVKDFKYRLSHSGIPSLEKYKMFRAEEVIKFIKGDTLDCAGEPSVEEWEKVDINGFKKQVPLSCQEEEWFKKSFDERFVIFSRTVRWQGDILVPNYDCAGLFIFQHWDSLTEKDIQAIFYLDKTLELIHEEIVHLPEFSQDSTQSARDGDTAATAPALPEALATPEAMALWQKAQKAGYVDEHYQPKLSRTQSALLADAMAEQLGIKNKWKVFENLWNRTKMYKDYYQAMEQKQSLVFQDKLKMLFN